MIKGTLVNAAAVIVGSGLGILVGHRLKGSLKDSVIKGLGLAVIVLGVKMAFEKHDFLAVLISIVIGTIIGELMDIEYFLDRTGDYFQKKSRSESNTFVTGFVTATILFCVGSMTIIGAIKDGLNNDPSVLYVKSMLDGVSSLILSSTLGVGVIFSTVIIILYQGGLSFGASKAEFVISNPMYINGISVTGGIIIVGIGLNMLGVTKIKTANMLPSLFVIPIYDFIYTILS